MENIWQSEDIANNLFIRVYERKFAMIFADQNSLLSGRQICLIELRV